MNALIEAIDQLGQYKAADAAGVGRTLVQAWRRNGKAPRWRAKEVARIIKAAERSRALEQERGRDAGLLRP